MPITGTTRLTGLLGSPVSHSLSPLMHNTAFQLLGLDYVYLCFDVKEDGLEEAVRGLTTIGVVGFNLTMPDKTRMVDLSDELSDAARLIGAVNTVRYTKGILKGYNTDGEGFWRSAGDHGFDPAGKTCVLLGAGGASSAVAVQGALNQLSTLYIFARPGSKRRAHTEALVCRLNEETDCHVILADYHDSSALRDALGASDILINGTPVGMSPDEAHSPIADASMLHPSLVVADLIYHPQETLLLKEAKAAGCTVFNGMDMLLYQGAAAFRLWTGHEMPIPAVRRTLAFSK